MPPARIFLTGEPGCGKTTALRQICELLAQHAIKTGGVISSEIREAGIRVGFQITDLMSDQSGILAHIRNVEGPHLGKYSVNLHDLEFVAVTAISRAVEEADVVIIDEIGPMELKSRQFVTAVNDALISPRPVIGTIHKRAQHELVTTIKSNPDYEIISVTLQNRADVPNRIVNQFLRK